MGVVEEQKPNGEVAITDHAEDFKPVSVSASQRLIYENQGVRYVLAINGDNYEKVAAEFEIYSWQLRKYNDADKKTKLNDNFASYAYSSKDLKFLI